MSRIESILFDLKESIDDLGAEIIQIQSKLEELEKQIKSIQTQKD